MRNIPPINLTPPTMSDIGLAGRTASEHLRLKQSDSGVSLRFPDHWNEPDVRGALYTAQGRACAYCGCALPRNDRGDVDHFRPKSSVRGERAHGGYWWLAYDFTNYLLSCRICNSTLKSDRFPIRTGCKRCTFDIRDRLVEEQRLLLHPLTDPIDNWLYVDWKGDLCKIGPNPKVALSDDQRDMIAETISFFKVNQDVRLVRQRMSVRNAVVTAIESGRIADAREMAIRFQPHSLVARQILVDTMISLPTPPEELSWLVKDIVIEIGTGLALIDTRNEENIAKQLSEGMWSLAVLRRTADVATAAFLESKLAEMDLSEDVRKRSIQLVAVRLHDSRTTSCETQGI